MSERAVRYVGHAELARGVNEAVGLVQRLEGRVLGLKSIDFGDCVTRREHQ